MSTLLSAHEIDVRYDAQSSPVLAKLTLGLLAGEFVGVLGPNGSGKSTLVRALSRTLRPTQGTVILGSKDLYRQSARHSAQHISVVPQSASVTLSFTVRDIVRMGRAPHLSRRPFAGEAASDENLVRTALRDAGVEDFAERDVTTLSGGEWQRTLIARALAQETEIILLDEPTAHLDIRHQWETLALVRSLARQRQKAVLSVLHDLNLAAAFCDRLLLLDGGRIAAEGSPAEVLTPETLEQVYGTRVWVSRHPTTGRPTVFPLPDVGVSGIGEAGATSHPVHVICGGGTGSTLLFALKERGLRVTVGALHGGDPDQETADLLGLPCATEHPFSPLSAAVLEQSRALGEGASEIIVTETPFGATNLANLEAVAAWQKAGKRVLCLETPGSRIADRDFTEGQAARLWERLRQEGALFVPDPAAVLQAIDTPERNH